MLRLPADQPGKGSAYFGPYVRSADADNTHDDAIVPARSAAVDSFDTSATEPRTVAVSNDESPTLIPIRVR